MKRRLGMGGMVLVCVLALGPAPLRADVGEERRALALHYYRGVVYFEAGRHDKALSEFRTVAETDPEYKSIQQYLSKTRALLQAHRADVLGIDEREIKGAGTDLYFVGKSFYEKGDYRRAAEAFKAVLDKNPEDKFAAYYVRLCEEALGGTVETVIDTAGAPYTVDEPGVLERCVAYMKDDIEEQQEQMAFYETRAKRRLQRDEMIREKEKLLKRQEALLEEEKKDYLTELRLSKKAERISKQAEKWRSMRERLESKEPGVPAALTEYPVLVNRGEQYYARMQEALRTSRWHSAGLNAISAATAYCDAVLVYHHGVKSTHPVRGNLMRLLTDKIRRADAAEYREYMWSILSLQVLVQDEGRPIRRSEALFLADKATKVVEWCRTFLP